MTLEIRASAPRYSRETLLACASGVFGNGRFPKLPLPPFLGVETVTSVTLPNDANSHGQIVGNSRTENYQWLFNSHFHGDPIMPGTFLIEGLLQLTGFYGGLLGFEGRGRAMRVGATRFLRQISPSDPEIEFVVNIRRVFQRRQLLIGDGLVLISGALCADVRGLCIAIIAEMGSEGACDAEGGS